MPRVSIVLPVYNGEMYLEESIQSVLKQSFQDWELIIVDDGSTDASRDIAQRFVSEDRRVRYFKNEKNIKLPSSLNRGFAKAGGEYWTWTSCDNAYHSSALQRMVDALDNQPSIGLIYTDMDLMNEGGIVDDHVTAGSSTDLIMRNVVGACFMYRADVARRVGEYNPDYFLCEDYEYWLRIAKITSIAPFNETLYNYRRHSKSLSAERHRDIIARGIAVQKQYYPDFIHSRKQAAIFYKHLRARDVYNLFRQIYFFHILYYSPKEFIKEILGLIKRRFIKT
jgi:glycosyltransferase involved in cell wall biosynthesis